MPTSIVGTRASTPVTATVLNTPTTAYPAGVATNDLVLQVGTAERVEIPTWSNSPIASRAVAQSTFVAGVHSYKRLGSGDLSATTTLSTTAGRRLQSGFIAVRGAGDPTYVAGTATSNSSGTTTYSGPTVTPSVADSLLVAVFSIAPVFEVQAGRTFTISAGWTEQIDVTSNAPSGAQAIVYIATRQLVGQAGIAQTAPVLTDVSGGGASVIPGIFVIPPTTNPPTGTTTVSPDFAVVDLSSWTAGSGGALSFSGASLPAGTVQAGAKFAVPRLGAEVTYTFTVAETANGSVTTTAIVPPISSSSAGYSIRTGNGVTFI